MENISNYIKQTDALATHMIISALGKIEAPIDVRKIAKHYKIEVVEIAMPSDNQSGMILIKSKDDVMIAINENEPESRRRFTIAHELGHYKSYELQGKTGEESVIEYRNGASSLGTSSEEVFANGFAASLLMPKDAIDDCIKYNNCKYVRELSAIFNVSDATMGFRLKKLGYL